MIWLLAAPIVSKAVQRVVMLVTALSIALLLGMPMLGILVDPWAPFRLSGQNGALTAAPAAIAAAVPAAVVAVPTLSALPQTSIVDGVIALAMTWRGVPYLWGGCDRRGIDCSCFVMNVWGAFGVSMPRVTTDQIRWATPVSREQAHAGDLVFFDRTCTGCGADPTHVGLYLGNGIMIDAGDPVQINPVFTGSYASHNPRFGRVH